MAKLSISKAWDDSRPIIARDGRLMFIIALATVVLPQTILYLVAPESSSTGALEVLAAGEAGAEAEAEAMAATGGNVLLSLLLGLVNLVGSIAIAYLALARGASVADGLKRGIKRLLPTIGMFVVLVGGAILIALLLAAVAGIGSVATGSTTVDAEAVSPIAGLVFVVVFGAMVWVAVRMMLVTPVIAAEDEGPFGIIKRSWRLTKGHFWRLLGFLLLFGIGALVFISAVSIIVGLAVQLIFGDPEPLSLAALFVGLAGGIATAILTVVYSTITARMFLQLAGKPADPDVEGLHATVPPTA